MIRATFFGVVAHLHLHGTWVPSLASPRREDEARDLLPHAFQLLRDRARGRHGTPAPLVADVAHGHHEADARWAHVGFIRDAVHLQANEVVRDQHSPQLLFDTVGGSAPQRDLGVEQVGLDLVVAELDLPAFVVELDELFGGVCLGVRQRGQQPLRPLESGCR